ncbi:21440_t:CDS:2, partial [Dentiscutata erythropus]
DNYFGSEPFNTPNINESFTSEISNTISEVSNITEISNTTSETSNNFDIIDETSNASSSSWFDVWKFFDKEKKDKTVTAKCKYCSNVRYSIIKDDLRSWIVLEDLSFTIVEGRIKSIIEKISKFHVVSTDTINLQQKTLDFVEVEGSHIGVNLANEVINVLEFYQIESK